MRYGENHHHGLVSIRMKKDIDTLIVDMIMDHYNIQSMQGSRELMTSKQFDRICDEAEKIFYESILITEEPGVA